MSINDRVREVRNALNLTQKEFGQKITLAQTYLSQIENGDRDVTEKIFKIICLQFSVNEKWLRTGVGEMFIEDDNVLLSQLSKQYNLDDFSRKFIETYINLPESHRAVIKSFASALAVEAADELGVDPAPEVSIDGNMVADPDIASELSSYAHELEMEKGVTEKSLAFDGTKEA